MRKPDLPKHKENVMSNLFGQIVGFFKSEGLTKGKEYDTKNQEVFECSKKILWLDQFHEDYQITVYLNSIQMFCEMGVVRKADMHVMLREKITDLRYKISEGTELELTDGSAQEFEKFFDKIKSEYQKIKDGEYV